PTPRAKPRSQVGSCGELGGGTGFQPVSGTGSTGKMPVPQPECHQFPHMSPQVFTIVAAFCLLPVAHLLMVVVLRGDEPPTSAVPPGGVIRLFNGRNLDGLSTWLQDTKHDDPRQVFRVGDGVLQITGAGNGYIATREEYRDYHLIVEYRWGKATDGG